MPCKIGLTTCKLFIVNYNLRTFRKLVNDGEENVLSKISKGKVATDSPPASTLLIGEFLIVITAVDLIADKGKRGLGSYKYWRGLTLAPAIGYESRFCPATEWVMDLYCRWQPD